MRLAKRFSRKWRPSYWVFGVFPVLELHTKFQWLPSRSDESILIQAYEHASIEGQLCTEVEVGTTDYLFDFVGHLGYSYYVLRTKNRMIEFEPWWMWFCAEKPVVDVVMPAATWSHLKPAEMQVRVYANRWDTIGTVCQPLRYRIACISTHAATCSTSTTRFARVTAERHSASEWECNDDDHSLILPLRIASMNAHLLSSGREINVQTRRVNYKIPVLAVRTQEHNKQNSNIIENWKFLILPWAFLRVFSHWFITFIRLVRIMRMRRLSFHRDETSAIMAHWNYATNTSPQILACIKIYIFRVFNNAKGSMNG